MASLFRRTAQMAASRSRRFGSHAQVHYEGAEAKLRAVLPHNHQIVLTVLGAYAAAIALWRSGGSSEEAPAKHAPAPVVADAADGAIPSAADASFDAWIKVRSVWLV